MSRASSKARSSCWRRTARPSAKSRCAAKEPTNLAFGGPDGKTVYVTQRQGGFIETFRVDRPGREFCLQREAGDPACR